MLRRMMFAGSCMVAALVSGAVAEAESLDRIQERGKIVVGVKNDYPPFGFVNPSGEIVGMEIDMARDIADRLAVELELVPVQTANRIEFLQQGRIDLILATMGDNEQRRRVVGIVDPNYYAGGTAILARKSAGLESWEELRGRDVCATQGAYYNRPVAEQYGANIVAFAGTPEALSALLTGSCIAFLQDSTLIQSILASGDAKWQDFEMPLPTENYQPWSIAVPLEERDGPFGQFIHEVIVDWHKSGKLIELEKKWGLPASEYLQEMHDKFSG